MRAGRSLTDVRVRVERVREPGVLGDGAVGEVELLRIGVGDRFAGQGGHVLDQGALHRHGGGDHRFGALVEIDELRVAAVFEVRDAGVGPHVLVVADELPIGVGGQRGLARAGEPEEDGGVAAIADIGRTVHGELALLGQHEVHDREHGLLVHTAVVGGAKDETHPVLDVDDHGAVAAGAVALGHALERRHVDEGPAGFGAVAVLTHGLREHDVAEVGVGRELADESVRLGEGRIPAAEDVGDVQVALSLVEVIDDPGEEGVERVGVEFGEAVLPPDPVGGAGSVDTVGVLHRTAGALGVGEVDEWTVDSERGGEGFLGVVGPVDLDSTSVVGDGFVEQFVLAESVAELDARESEGGLQLGGDVGGRGHGELPAREVRSLPFTASPLRGRQVKDRFPSS